MVTGQEDLWKDIERITSHHWVRHTEQSLFHAYLKIRPDFTSVCGEGKPFDNVRNLDIPGERSKCCIRCCEALYGPIGHKPPARNSVP